VQAGWLSASSWFFFCIYYDDARTNKHQLCLPRLGHLQVCDQFKEKSIEVKCINDFMVFKIG
jgi:hypothetical protein